MLHEGPTENSSLYYKLNIKILADINYNQTYLKVTYLVRLRNL